ncbi:MAG: alpha/beta hydrolase [Candidatus Pseudobacter hemicellulosilyticus]|uniref:Alpha/beta hydrolase n=1 Tax=Candidatus Pseudobacter hemicellulosilyticus TaxID=3121375 RepID=A0AAJ5WT76_9BACT|nr:MAG: alpha/beta hydrolase [Pseudobacter sp.]
MKQFLFLLALAGLSSPLSAQTTIPLYDHIPNSLPGANEERSQTDANGITRISAISQPTLEIYLPPKEKATGTAVVIIPGGGYSIVAYSHEGTDVAKKFNEMGIAAFVLKYRLPEDKLMPDRSIGPVQDAQRAIQLVRERAAEWQVNPEKVGIMGFSAGGHLASTAGTHFTHHYIEVPKKTNLRPDFMLLIYPVISFRDSITHMGSRNRLIGEHPAAEKIKAFSNDEQVTRQTPPTFLVHARDDKAVPVANSERFYAALQKHKIPAQLYLYEQGGHGFGMNNKTSEVKWMELVQTWLKEQRFL